MESRSPAEARRPPRDDPHDAAVDLESVLSGQKLVTSDLVLAELLNFFCAFGPELRERAAQVVDELRIDADAMEVVPDDPDLFDRTLEFYRARPDKEYSFVDCSSMVLMSERGIVEVATADHHFAQEGFVLLLE
jgi:predicted nucleic acid-binding protein